METQAGFLITQIKQIGGRVFDKILQKEGISEFNGAQGKILYVLWQHDCISIIELSRLTGLANTTLTSMLDRMEAAELLHRLPDPKDRRKSLIMLTEKSERLKESYDKVSLKMHEVYFKNFSTEEIITFEKYLRRVLNNVKEEMQ
ncbi:MAG: MarR family transcriptional regulator [Lachnospiraceae bacterium]|nr:MarR family transcriptional regulator [Lachnospiraceae bacterium]